MSDKKTPKCIGNKTYQKTDKTELKTKIKQNKKTSVKNDKNKIIKYATKLSNAKIKDIFEILESSNKTNEMFIQILLSCKPNDKIINYACKYKKYDVLSKIFFGEINIPLGLEHILNYAIEFNDINLLTWTFTELVSYMDVEEIINYYKIVLNDICISGNLHLFKLFLLNKPTDISYFDIDIVNSFKYACELNQKEIAQWLKLLIDKIYKKSYVNSFLDETVKELCKNNKFEIAEWIKTMK